MELLSPDVAVAAHLGDEPLGEGVDDRYPHSVQAPGDGVGALFELATRMEGGEDGGEGRLFRLLVDVHRDAPAVVRHPHAPVGEERHFDLGAVAGHRLVDGVVHHLPHQVVQTPRPGGTDVHAGPSTHRLEALQDGDVLGPVRVGSAR